MSVLSETDPNASLCSRYSRHPSKSLLSHQTRIAGRICAKNDDQDVTSSPFEQTNKADEQTSLDEVPCSTPPKEVVLNLRKHVLPYASSVNAVDHSPQDQPTTIKKELNLLSDEPANAKVGRNEAVSVGQDVVKSDESTKPATSDPERRAPSQENTESTIDVQQILRHPLNEWLLLHPGVGPRHFEWIRQSLRAAAVEEVYHHPDLHEFLELAIKFGPKISNADEPSNPDTAVVHDTSIPKSDHSTIGVRIPGLTFNNEEEAEWESMVEEACKTSPIALDLKTLLTENEDADAILICHEYASHLTADELAEVVVLGEGDLIRMLDIICEMYE